MPEEKAPDAAAPEAAELVESIRTTVLVAGITAVRTMALAATVATEARLSMMPAPQGN